MRRPYFFEIFAVANLLAVALLAHETLPILGSPILNVLGFTLGLGIQAVIGIAVRSVISLVRRDKTYFRIIATRAWLFDTLRLILFGAIVVLGYGWLKLVVPVYHARLFDQALWNLDRMLFFGISPATFFLELFRDGWFLRTIDWLYANIFYASGALAFAYFLSDPSRRVRVAFANGNSVLWIWGAWLYLAIPSLGPAFRFPDLWFAHHEGLRVTQSIQPALMRNYQNVLRAAAGLPVKEEIRTVLGIGAFPSLHVAFQMYVFLWMRRLWTWGEVIFAIFVMLIFIGSMITGWHYMVDGLAGAAMAYICYRTTWRSSRMSHWLELRAR